MVEQYMHTIFLVAYLKPRCCQALLPRTAAKGLHRWSRCHDAGVPIDLMILVLVAADTAAVPALAARGLDFTRALVVGAAQHPGRLVLHRTCWSLAEKNGEDGQKQRVRGIGWKGD